MDILEKHFPDECHVFVWQHTLKQADDALSACKMSTTKPDSPFFGVLRNVVEGNQYIPLMASLKKKKFVWQMAVLPMAYPSHYIFCCIIQKLVTSRECLLFWRNVVTRMFRKSKLSAQSSSAKRVCVTTVISHTQTFCIFDISHPKSIHIGHSAHSFQWTSQSYSHIMIINVSRTNITTYNLFHAVITVVKFYGYNQCSDIPHSYCLTYYIGNTASFTSINT
jgi:hypothetical protein